MKTEINGINLNFESFGNGEPLLLVHGWGGDKDSLKALARALENDFNVYLLDLPGFGGSSTPPSDWDPMEYPKTVYMFIKHLNLACLHYGGHSFGGGIGVKIAYENPTLFKNLVLMSAAFHRDPQKSKKAMKVKKIIPFYDRFKDNLLKPRRLYYKIFLPNSDALKKPELEKIYRKLIRQDLSDLVPGIKSSTLILWGQKDLSTPLSDGYFLRDNIEDSELIVYDDLGHNFPIVAPEQTAQDIINYIKR